MAKIADQDYEMVPVDQLEVHPDNPNQGDLKSIGSSIDALDFYGAVVIQKSTSYILAGNHRYLAAKSKGLTEVPTIVVDVDDDRARRILLADNRNRDLATYDERALAELLTDLGDLAGTGYGPADLASLQQVSGMLGDAASAFLDEVPTSPPPPPRTIPPMPQTDTSHTPATGSGTTIPTAPPAPATAMPRIETVQVSWALTVDQRDLLRTAITHAQNNTEAATQPDALTAIAAHYLATAPEGTAT